MNLRSVRLNKKIYYYNDLFYDYIFDFERLSGFFNYDYRDIDSYKIRVDKVLSSYDEKIREKITGLLVEYNQGLGCSKKTIDNLKKIREKRSAVVIGGQQPALLSGPVFLIYKIITILVTARSLEEKLNIDVVPIFWNASDDSDLSQVDRFSFINDGLSTYLLKTLDKYKGFMFSKIPFSITELDQTISFIKDNLNESEFKREIIDFIKKCFKKDKNITVAYFFSKICSSLFSEYGLVMIDPNYEGIKELTSDIIKGEIANSGIICRIVNDAGMDLKGRGYHSQLNATDKNLNIFFNGQKGRSKIVIENDKYIIDGQAFEKEEILKRLLGSKQDISPNVILRPIFQDSILPVLCTVCGPSEVSYYAQLKEIYRLFDVDMPIIYPRFMATLTEKKIRKAMDHVGLDYDMLYIDKDKHINEALREKIDLDASVDDLREDLGIRLKEFENELLKNYNTIGTSFDRINRNINKEIDILEKKILSEQKKENKYLMSSLDKIFLNIFPKGDLQERTVNIFSYINKYGFKLLDDIIGQYEPFDFYHKTIEFV